MFYDHINSHILHLVVKCKVSRLLEKTILSYYRRFNFDLLQVQGGSDDMPAIVILMISYIFRLVVQGARFNSCVAVLQMGFL